MPQMSALLWGILFLLFSALTLMTVIKTFFSFKMYSESTTKEMKNTSNKINWAW